MNILIGADPELFGKRDGKYVSAYNLIPGDKANPHRVDNGAVQVDGMAFEFNINPADSGDGFIFNIQSVLEQLRAMVPDYEVVADPVADFDLEYIASQPPEARDLGCDPDFNAWSGAVNEKPNVNLPMRTAAGHIHIGFTEDARGPEHFEICRIITQQLDFYLGLPSLLFDNDQRRRDMYGKAGAFRPKSYGVEYRVLSNAWLRDDKLMRWAFDAAQQGVQSVRGYRLTDKYGDIQEIINNGDIASARRIIDNENLPVPEGIV